MNLNTDVIFFMCMLNHYSHVQTFGTQWSSPSGSPVHSVQEARTLEWVTNAFLQGIFLTQGLKPCFLSLLQCQVGSLPLAPPGSPLHLLQKINSKSITDLHISHKIIYKKKTSRKQYRRKPTWPVDGEDYVDTTPKVGWSMEGITDKWDFIKIKTPSL